MKGLRKLFLSLFIIGFSALNCFAAQRVTPIISTFSNGELSPYLDARTDVQAYFNGAKEIENFFILPYGGLMRRPGTYYVAEVKTPARKTRLIPFQFSTTQAYIIEVGHEYMRFYKDEGQIVENTISDEGGKAITVNGDAILSTAQHKFGVASAYFDGTGDWFSLADHADWNFGTGNFTIDLQLRMDELPGVESAYDFVSQFIDANNYWYARLYETSGNYRMQMGFVAGGVDKGQYITGNLSLSTGVWNHIAFVRNGATGLIFINGVSQSLTEVTAFSTNNTDPTGTAVLAIGQDGNSGAYIKGYVDELRISKASARWTLDFTPPTTAYTTDGTTVFLSHFDGNTPYEIETPYQETDLFDLQFTQDADTMYITHPSYKPRELTRSGHSAWGIATYTPTADPFTTLGIYPSCVSIYEQRLAFANTNTNPQQVLFTQSGDYDDMTTGSNAGDAMVYTIGSEQVNAIKWLSAGKVLLMGTSGGVFNVSSGSVQEPLTPTNVVVKKETSYGSNGIMPKRIGNFAYYLQRNSKILREMGYSYELDEYQANDATILSEHITGDGIVDMDYQQAPYNMLWCVRSDGEAAVMTRQIEQQVKGWSRMVTDGNFESVAVIPGSAGEDDEVWFIVKRYINGAWHRYVEYLKPTSFTEQEDAYFVDCGLSLDNPIDITDATKANPVVITAPGHGFSSGDTVIIRNVAGMIELNKNKYLVSAPLTTTFMLQTTAGVNVNGTAYTTYVSGGEVRKCSTAISGLDHLEGETLQVLGDGIALGDEKVASTAITIDSASGEVHAGLPFTSTLQTMRLEGGSALGTSQTKTKRISKVVLRLYKSLECKAGNEITQDALDFDDVLFTGDKEIVFPSSYDKDAYVRVIQDKPLPLNLLAIIPYYIISDD